MSAYTPDLSQLAMLLSGYGQNPGPQAGPQVAANNAPPAIARPASPAPASGTTTPPPSNTVPPMIARPAPSPAPAATATPPTNQPTPVSAATPTGAAPGAVQAAPAAPASGFTAPTMPTAPTPPNNSALLQRQQQLQAIIGGKPPVAKPSIFDRIMGGITAFGAGLQHNPNAFELGASVTGRKQAQADKMYSGQVGAAQREEGDIENQLSEANRNYEQQNTAFKNQMDIVNADRANQLASSTIKANEAKADKYNYQAMGPEERSQAIPGIEKAIGRSLTDDEKKAFVMDPGKALAKVLGNETTPDKPLTNYMEALVAYQTEKDPTKKAQLKAALTEYEQHQETLKQEGPPKGPGKNGSTKGTPKQFEDIDAKKDAANTKEEQQYQQERQLAGMLKDPTARQQALDKADSDHEDRKQQIQNNYEDQNRDLGGTPEHFNTRASAGGGKGGTGKGAAAAPTPSRLPEGFPKGSVQMKGPKGTFWVKPDKIQKFKDNGYKQV